MSKKERQGIEAKLGVETTLTVTQDDLVDASDFEEGVCISDLGLNNNPSAIALPDQDVQIIEPIRLPEPIPQPEKIEHSFYTAVKKVARKKEVSSLAESEQPKRVLVNNINLGEISTTVLETIKYPAVVRAYFYALELSICYRLNSKDTLETALSTLRDAIFAAQYDKPLPKDCYVQSSRTLAAGTGYVLQNSIDVNQGVIDAVIQAYDCSE